MRQVETREGARRQHRAIGVYAALQCWIRRLDGVVIGRATLERLIGLERFRGARQVWLREDLEPLFPFVRTIPAKGTRNSLHSIYLARVPFAEHFGTGSMSTRARVEHIKARGIQLDEFILWERIDDAIDGCGPVGPLFAGRTTRDEHLLVTYLALLSQGVISPVGFSGFGSASEP